MAVKYDYILGKIRLKDRIPQLNADPTSPKAEDAWVLKTGNYGGAGVGEAYGLLLALTKPGEGSVDYSLSYRTKEGSTKRVALT